FFALPYPTLFRSVASGHKRSMLPTTSKPLSASSAAATDESTPPDIPTSTLGGTAPGAASPDVVGTCSALTARQHTHHAVPRGARGGRTRTPRAGGDWT